ncbi:MULTISPECIES: hypothetical protein [unclassified Nostoc]|nr:hypothetical protein [Nostoc sp. ChiQUE02]MDZ8228540.1 hypothetical protein [Nostoc sp. ChiQUE02]
MTEATTVEAQGRITPEELEIWYDACIEMLTRIVMAVQAAKQLG